MAMTRAAEPTLGRPPSIGRGLRSAEATRGHPAHCGCGGAAAGCISCMACIIRAPIWLCSCSGENCCAPAGGEVVGDVVCVVAAATRGLGSVVHVATTAAETFTIEALTKFVSRPFPHQVALSVVLLKLWSSPGIFGRNPSQQSLNF